ncbi:FAD-binding protein [Streptomyces sp. NPDC054796]
MGAAARHRAVPRLSRHLRHHLHLRGVRIDARARVLDTSGHTVPGLYAAGELVGGLFCSNYPGGSGLTAGSVFGRRYGHAALSADESGLEAPVPGGR